jgi:hypothetical protein
LVVIYSAHYAPGQSLAYVERFDKQGNSLWLTPFPQPYGSWGNFVTIAPHPDGSYFGVWAVDHWDPFFVTAATPDVIYKLKPDGQFAWQRMNPYRQNMHHLFAAQNGDVIGCGLAEREPDDDNEWFAGYVHRMDTAGQTRWTRHIIDSTHGAYIEYFYYGLELPNGDLMFSGEVSDTLPYYNHPDRYDAWLVRTDVNGCFTPGCAGLFESPVSSREPVREPGGLFALLPNPFRDQLGLGTLLGRDIPPGAYRAQVWDARGRLLQEQAIRPELLSFFDLRGQPPGLYVVQVLRDGRPVQTLKGVKME